VITVIVTVVVVVVVVTMVVAVVGTVISGGICDQRVKTVSHWARISGGR
jgi:hypothetical protein